MSEKSPIELLLDRVEWREVAQEFPEAEELHATHEGCLYIGDIPLRVYQLSDGTRVIEASDMERFLGGPF